MNKIEEQLWSYIDGNCTTEEQTFIEQKLANDIQYQTKYQELLIVNNQLNELDFEEPSMSFTRNVMEQVKLEIKPVALKTKVDNRIIYGIMGFFILSMAGIFGYIISQSDLNFSPSLLKVNWQFDVEKLINPTFIYIFLMVDVVLALLYMDSFIRKRNLKVGLKKDGN